MHASLLRPPVFLSVVAVVALGGFGPACSSDRASPTAARGSAEAPSVQEPPVVPPAPGSSAVPPSPPPEPEWQWVAPKVASTSAACGTARNQAIGETFTTPTGRTFHVWGPSGYDPNKTYPVLMVFHGWQTQARPFESWFKMEAYASNEPFVVYPDAVNGLWDVNGMSDVVFFDEIVKQLGETYCINPSRVFGFGFSYGGRFINQLGCKRAGYVKAISIGDGGDGGDGQRCGRLPVLVTVRTHDTDERPEWGKAASLTWASRNRCAQGTDPGDAAMNCISHRACETPGAVTFCEDAQFDASWPQEWNHTVREPYRAYTWKWFSALP